MKFPWEFNNKERYESIQTVWENEFSKFLFLSIFFTLNMYCDYWNINSILLLILDIYTLHANKIKVSYNKKMLYLKRRVLINWKFLNFEFSKRILQCLELHIETVHQIFHLRFRIKYFNTLSVCIVPYTEWSRNEVSKFPEKVNLKKNEIKSEPKFRNCTKMSHFIFSLASSNDPAT